MKTNRQKNPTIEYIIDTYCNVNELNKSSILSKTRETHIIWHRHNLAHFINANVGIKVPLAIVGQSLGNRDHATVLNSIKSAKNLLETDSEYRAQYKLFCGALMVRMELEETTDDTRMREKLRKYLEDAPKFAPTGKAALSFGIAYDRIDAAINAYKSNL